MGSSGEKGKWGLQRGSTRECFRVRDLFCLDYAGEHLENCPHPRMNFLDGPKLKHLKKTSKKKWVLLSKEDAGMDAAQ